MSYPEDTATRKCNSNAQIRAWLLVHIQKWSFLWHFTWEPGYMWLPFVSFYQNISFHWASISLFSWVRDSKPSDAISWPLVKKQWHLSWRTYKRRPINNVHETETSLHQNCSLWCAQARDVHIRPVEPWVVQWYWTIPSDRDGHWSQNMWLWKADFLQRAPPWILLWSSIKKTSSTVKYF